MYCEKCGTENQFEGAAFCKSCHQPLQPKPVAASEEHSGAHDSTDLNLKEHLKEQSIAEIPLQDVENDRIDMADPIDFIMGNGSYNTGPDKNDPGDVITPEPEEKDPTEYGDKEIQLNLSEAESESIVKMEALGSITDDVAQAIEVREPAVEKNEERLWEDHDEKVADDEDMTATQKIRLQNLKAKMAANVEKKPDHAVATEPPILDLPRVARSKGIIYLSGETLTLTGGVKILSGDEVQIGDQLYEVRPKPKDNRRLIGAIAGGIVVIVALLVLISGFSGGENGQIIGIAYDDASGSPLSKQSITIVELGRTVHTNQAGFFIFDDLPSGLYTIQHQIDGSPVAEERVAVLENDITTVTLYKGQPISSIPIKPTASGKRETVAVKSDSKTEPGALKLTVSPKGAAAYLDDKPLGVGSNSYRVRPGRYVLSVKKKGYKTKSRQITVKSGKSLSYKFTLAEGKSSTKKKSNGKLAYENEIAGNYNEALRYYDKVLQKKPQDLGALLGKARCFKKQGQLDQATSYFMQAARIAGSRGDVATQIEGLTGVIDARPNTFTAYYSRGDLYFSQEDYGHAAQDFEKVIQIDHRNLGAYYKLGNSYYRSGDYNEALAAFQGAENLNFADPKAHFYMAKTYLALSDSKNMKKSYEKFTELASYSVRLEFKNDPEWQKVLSAMKVEN